MPNTEDDTVHDALDTILLPVRYVRTTRFSRSALVLIVLVLAGTVAIAEPHVRGWIAESFLENCMAQPLKGKQYCDFFIILFQMVIALVIGGIVITDEIVDRIQRAVQFAEARGLKLTEEEEARIKKAVMQCVKDLREAWAKLTILSLPKALGVTYTTTNRILRILFQRTPLFLAVLLTFRLLASFPKGLYGVLALAAFEGMLFAQALKTYYEYLPECPK